MNNKEEKKRIEIVRKKLKLYKQYLESEDTSIHEQLNKEIGENELGENLVMKFNSLLKNTITYKQIKKGKCPKSYLKNWMRFLDGEPEFEKVSKSKSKKKPAPINQGISIPLKYINQLADIININKQKAIHDLNKATIEIKFNKKIEKITNNNPKLIDEYHKFFRSFDKSVQGLKKKESVINGTEQIQYINLLKGKIVKWEELDYKVALSLWSARVKWYGLYPVN